MFPKLVTPARILAGFFIALSVLPVAAQWQVPSDEVPVGIGPGRTGFRSTYTPPGTGAVARTVKSKITETVSVTDFGAVCDGVTDDTVAIQKALTYAHTASPTTIKVKFPPRTCFVSATLQAYSHVWLDGEGVLASKIYRTGDYGPTIQFGTGIAGNYAENIHVSNIFFQHSTDYVQGDTSLPNKAGGSAHLHIFGSQQPIIENNRFHRMPYAVVFDGGSVITLRNNLFYGIWDHAHSGAQEGIAQVLFAKSAVYGNPTSAFITNNYFAGSTSGTRSVTYTASDGSATVSQQQNIGNLYGLQFEGLEDAVISDNYFGSHNLYSIYYGNITGSVTIGHRISGNFFDAARDCQINMDTQSVSAETIKVVINANTFNGQQNGLHGVCARDTTKTSIYNLQVTNNSFLAHVGTPILLTGATGANVSGNIITGYNSQNASPGADNAYAAAAYIAGSSAYVRAANNTVGGGGNSFSQDVSVNFTYLGIVNSGATNTQGGNVSAGVTTTFPTQVLSPTAASIGSSLTITGNTIGSTGLAITGTDFPNSSFFQRGSSDTAPFLASVNTQSLASSTLGWGLFDRGTDGNFQLRAKVSSTSWTTYMTVALTDGTITLATALPGVSGGTGQSSYTLGDLLYGSGSTALSKLAGNTTTTKQFLSQTGSGSVSAAPAWATIAGSDITGAALTKTDDTNVTLTLGGTPATSLLRAASITVGWTGTLAAARLNSNVVQAITNDTNVTGSITSQNLTLAWTGVLASTRGGAGGLTGLVLGNGASAPTAYAGTSCTNQFPRSLNASGVATCASVANTDLTNSAITIAGTSVSLGSSITAATLKAGLGYPTSSTDNTVPRFDLTSGNLQTSGVTIDDSNNLGGVASITASAAVYSFTGSIFNKITGGDGTNGYVGTESNHGLSLITNNTPRLTIGSDGGVFSVGATGGSKGSGTINIQTGYYANGTAGVTCGAGLGGTSRTTLGLVTTC